MFKTNSEVIKIEAKKIKPINTGVVFWSHDRGTAKLKFKLMKDNLPQPIPDGTIVPIRLTFSSPTAEGGIGKHDYLATIEDKIGGIVSITLQDNILGYQGIVHGSIYMDFPGNTSLDTAGRFSFEIQRSPIDETTPELEDYYFNGFSKVIDQVEQLIDDTNKRIDGLNTEIDKANGTLDRIEDEIKESAGMTEKFINSIDFGDYDYSGRPNLMPNLDFSKLSKNGSASQELPAYVKDGGTFFVIDRTDTSFVSPSTTNVFIPFLGRLEKGATYVVTIPMMVSEDFGTNYGSSAIYPYNVNDGVITTRPLTMTPNADCRGKWQLIKKAFTVPSDMSDGKFAPYLHVYQRDDQTGKLYIGYDIKIEKVNSTSDTATPYQPNLLDAPYYLSKVALGENIADPAVKFPINVNTYKVYEGDMLESFKVGETYTVTIKGRKPAQKTFSAYNAGTVFLGNLTPVEGLSDVWSSTFKVSLINSTYPNRLQLYQLINDNQNGEVQIDWLKIEKGDTRTPNIDHLRYRGIGVTKNSINKYLWEENTLLEKVYTNSIDFGNHDYSGNPNISPVINDENVSSINSTWTKVTPHGTFATAEKIGTNLSVGVGMIPNRRYDFSKLTVGKQYTLTIPMRINADFTGKISDIFIRMRCTSTSGDVILDTKMVPANTPKEEFVDISHTFTVPSTTQNSNNWYCQVGFSSNSDARGTVDIGYKVKLEEGPTATPYQPNLLDEPYYLSKVPLGENIASPAQTFPIVTSSETLYGRSAIEDFIVGKTYIVTMKATKPASQSFVCYLAENQMGTFKPVEGLTDVWTTTIKIKQLGNNKRAAYILQTPKNTLGNVKIDWIKIEKGDTRTPNILCYKYRGVNNFVSKNPKDYIWDINNDYAQQIFDDTVSLTKPQTIISVKNFEEVPTVKNQPIHYGPQLFEGWYGSGEEHAGMGTKTRLRVGGLVVDGRDQLSEPFTWNSGRYEATVNRDITFYCKGTMFVEMGGNIGKYIYIANWKNSEQTQYASGLPAGVGTNLDGGLYYRNMLDFSWIVQLRQGDKFSIGIELASGKTVSKIQIRTLHIKELVPPTN